MEEQIKELSEKLRFANETIAHLVDKEETREQEQINKEENKEEIDESQSSFSQFSASNKKLSGKLNQSMKSNNYETESLPPEMLQLRIEDLEMVNQDLIDEIEGNKLKARGLLMRKEMAERRIKMVVYKLE